jgi:chromosome segregation ATPase
MSNSTPEEKIAVLNIQKQKNTDQVSTLDTSVQNYNTLINNYTSAIGEFETQITALQASITALESDNIILDEVIVDETPPQS